MREAGERLKYWCARGVCCPWQRWQEGQGQGVHVGMRGLCTTGWGGSRVSEMVGAKVAGAQKKAA